MQASQQTSLRREPYTRAEGQPGAPSHVRGGSRRLDSPGAGKPCRVDASEIPHERWARETYSRAPPRRFPPWGAGAARGAKAPRPGVRRRGCLARASRALQTLRGRVPFLLFLPPLHGPPPGPRKGRGGALQHVHPGVGWGTLRRLQRAGELKVARLQNGQWRPRRRFFFAWVLFFFFWPRAPANFKKQNIFF